MENSLSVTGIPRKSPLPRSSRINFSSCSSPPPSRLQPVLESEIEHHDDLPEVRPRAMTSSRGQKSDGRSRLRRMASFLPDVITRPDSKAAPDVGPAQRRPVPTAASVTQPAAHLLSSKKPVSLSDSFHAAEKHSPAPTHDQTQNHGRDTSIVDEQSPQGPYTPQQSPPPPPPPHRSPPSVPGDASSPELMSLSLNGSPLDSPPFLPRFSSLSPLSNPISGASYHPQTNKHASMYSRTGTPPQVPIHTTPPPPPVHSTNYTSSHHSTPSINHDTPPPSRTATPPEGGRRLRHKASRMSGSTSGSMSDHKSGAWVLAGEHEMDYNLSLLTAGEKVPELWDEQGDTFVYLFPRSTGRTPSFKVSSASMAASQPFVNMLHGVPYTGRARKSSFDGRISISIHEATPSERARRSSVDSRASLSVESLNSPHGRRRRSFDGRVSLSVEDAHETRLMQNADIDYLPMENNYTSPQSETGSLKSFKSFDYTDATPQDIHLYFPVNLSALPPKLSAQDVQTLVEIRNFFAFLNRQPLVATPSRPTVYQVFLGIASFLKTFEFSNLDGSTWGEEVETSLRSYMEQFRLGDVTESREKTLEGLILGERLRCRELYNESFAHAVGKYTAVQDMKSPLFDLLSNNTRNRLERGAMTLSQRQRSVGIRLMDFDFPSLFAGIGASTSSAEAKFVRFKGWRTHFLALRKQVLSYLKHLHGQWPPKASSKKNQFVEGGLNRLVLKGLYSDMCSLYDLLVDREAITTRTYDAPDNSDITNVDPTAAALRKLLGEYDRSSPPVQPPIPFDVPQVPRITTLTPQFHQLAPKDQHKLDTTKLKEAEVKQIFQGSYNSDANFSSPFLDMYRAFEQKEAKGRTAQDLSDQRYGYWIFVYAVIQALPMLVIDAPDVQFTQGVEYFLCVPPMGNSPWMEDASSVKMAWYGVQGGAGVVSLPSDVVNHGVEGIYRRSHAWIVADRWLSHTEQGYMNVPEENNRWPAAQPFSPLDPPPGFGDGSLGLRSLPDRPQSSGGQSSRGISHSPVRRGRVSNSARNSVALGLEELPIPSGFSGLNPNGTSRTANNRTASPRPSTGRYRAESHSTAASSSHVRSRSLAPPQAASKRESTFDDILGSMDFAHINTPTTRKKK